MKITCPQCQTTWVKYYIDGHCECLDCFTKFIPPPKAEIPHTFQVFRGGDLANDKQEVVENEKFEPKDPKEDGETREEPSNEFKLSPIIFDPSVYTINQEK